MARVICKLANNIKSGVDQQVSDSLKSEELIPMFSTVISTWCGSLYLDTIMNEQSNNGCRVQNGLIDGWCINQQVRVELLIEFIITSASASESEVYILGGV